MKHTTNLGMIALLSLLLLAGCGSAFHNGTEMDVSSVLVTGLPTNPYTPGQTMVFSYCYDLTADTWVHSSTADFSNARYNATVAADGSLTYSFSPPLVIKTSIFKFLLIDPGKQWGVMKIDKKHSGKNGGDVTLDNTWAGAAAPVTVTGVVSGDNVTWTLE